MPSSELEQNLLSQGAGIENRETRTDRRDFLGIPIDLVNPDEPLAEILSWRRVGHRGYVTLINPHSVLTCARDPSMYRAVMGCDLALPDGVGITMAARLLGYVQVHRIPGPSLMSSTCDRGRTHNLRHFFYGGAEGVAAAVAVQFAQRFPGLQVAGTCCPPFRQLSSEEDARIVEEINASCPDVVWVGLGTAKQEKWMASHVGRLQASALLGVGAAFDFHAGTIPWAPAWVRRVGLEWAYRLAHEPHRLWRRNLDSPVFLARIVAQRIGLHAGRI